MRNNPNLNCCRMIARDHDEILPSKRLGVQLVQVRRVMLCQEEKLG